MRYGRVLGLAALAVAFGCQDANQPNGKTGSISNPEFTVAGAGFTTTNPAEDNPTADPAIELCLNGPGTVNCNLYGDKDFVWINGGPNQTGPSALSDGVYFFTVVEPGGENDPNDGGAQVLSDPAGGDAYTNRVFTTSGGDIDAYFGTHSQSTSLTQGLQIRLMPYDDTSNPGGVYILAICRIDLQTTYNATTKTYDVATDPVTPDDCKYDAFKAREGGTVITEFPEVSGLKYYDANLNGQHDAGEVGIANWPIDFQNGVSGTVSTIANGTFTMALVPDVYTFQEQVANAPWIQTGNTVDQSLPASAADLLNFIYTVTVDQDDITGLNFGNVCVGAGGGHTLGFWSNQNGKTKMNDGGTLAPELALLAARNLRNANGTNFDPTTYAQFRTWLLSASATNMAYMLSAQMAAMELNVEGGFVNSSALILAPGTNSANALGFATVGAILTEANTELGLHGLVLSGSAFRTYQTALKNALDNANNNLLYLQAGPSTCPTPVFPN